MGSLTWGVSNSISIRKHRVKGWVSDTMEVARTEWSEVRKVKYQLPEIVYHKGSYCLDSSAELAHLDSHKGQKPFWNYLMTESPDSAYQQLPGAKEITSLTYLGERRRHPSLRLRIYQVLQH